MGVFMKLRYVDGTEAEGSVSKGRNNILTIFFLGSTGAQTKEELKEYIKVKRPYRMEEFEIVEASPHEKKLLREAGFKLKGL